jgi:hypothetical protein
MVHCQSSLFDADPDLACHFDTDPDPTFHFEADPDLDPEPSFQIKAQKFEKVLNYANIPYILACHLQIDETRIRIRILTFNLTWTHADPDSQHFKYYDSVTS